MINEYEGFNIVKMAEYLKLRKNTQKETLLVLGARAGGLFRSGSLSEALSTFSDNFEILSYMQRFAECFNILKRGMLSQPEIDKLVKSVLEEVSFDEADYCIAQLVKRGYFNTLITTNVDNILEQAFTRAKVEIEMFVPGATVDRNLRPTLTMLFGDLASKKYASDKRNLRSMLIKPFGDLASGEYSINNRTNYVRRAEALRRIMNDKRNMAVLLVGLDPIWDHDIFSLLFPLEGHVWYVDEERPLMPSPLARYLQKSKVQYITSDEGRYTSFFRNLYRQIVGDSDPARRVKAQLPPSTDMVSLLSTDDLVSALREQALVVRQRDQEAPKLRVTMTPLYTRLPSGVLAYYHAETMPLVQYKIENNGPEAVKVVLSVEIAGYALPAIDTFEVQPQSWHSYHQLPRLETDKAGLLTETISASVRVRVCYLRDGVELPYDTLNFSIRFMACNLMRWAVPDIRDRARKVSLLKHLAAWVTPSTNLVKVMFRNAIYYHPRKTLNGYPSQYSPDAPRSQVKAIFQALKEIGEIVHSASRFVVSPDGNDVIQTIRLPDECLRERKANCIEGAVLYASLIECASLEPVIVLQKDHAFVGWKTGKNSTEYEFLETTMTQTASFDEAFAEGMDAYWQLKKKRLFECEPFDKNGFACLLDIKQLRDVGIYPMLPRSKVV